MALKLLKNLPPMHINRPISTEKAKRRQRLGGCRGIAFYLALIPAGLANRPLAEWLAISYM